MKLKEGKHNHNLTNIIKAALFSLILFLPIMNVAVRCGYVMLNKNAYQSYSGTNQNTETIVNINTINNFDYSKTYYLGNSALSVSPSSASSSAYMYFDSVDVITNNTTTSTELIEQFDRMYIYASSTTMFYNFYIGQTNYTLNSGQDFLLQVKIRSFNGTDSAFTALNFDVSNSNMLYYIDYFITQQLDNAFEYSIDKLTETPIYNWTLNTGMYTGIAAMTTGMGITATVIPMLITYWLFITVIYVILDIVIQIFVWLTHLLQEKS